jgi:hypothetical protein
MDSKSILADVTPILASAKMRMNDSAAFKEHLRVLFHIIRASFNLLVCARDRSSDPVLRAYFLDHANEESSHDIWLGKDLEDSGVEIGDCPMLAAQLPGMVYYHIHHTSECALLGYMLVMEGFPMPLQVVEMLEEIHGKDLLRTTRYHAEHDPAHSKELFAVIDNLSDQQKAVVRKVAIETAAQVAGIVNYIQKVHCG